MLGLNGLSPKHYGIGIAAIVCLSASLRFWQLGRFNVLVFDEIYFVKFAQAYLAGVPEFDAHPPLGKYLIAIGIWLSAYILPIDADTAYRLVPGVALPAFGYRWMNALVGCLIPLVVMGIAQTVDTRKTDARKGIDKRFTFSLLAGGFVAIDGLFVAESRYALINIYVVFFGLLGHWLWLRSGSLSGQKKTFTSHALRVLSAVAIALSIAVKWNGLGYLLSLFIWEIWRVNITTNTRAKRFSKPKSGQAKFGQFRSSQFKSRLIAQGLFQGGIYGLLIPLLTYSLVWWPHLHLTGQGFIPLHTTLITFHRHLQTDHIACSSWASWPLLIRPVAYWYETTSRGVHTVTNMGNPVLWWLAIAAIILFLVESIASLKNRFTDKRYRADNKQSTDSGFRNMSAYLLISYASNWLPWIFVSRCTYLYLFMPAAVFGFMALAWLLSEWLHSASESVRTIGWAMLGAIALSAVFWLPLNLGSPLSPEALQVRWWIPSWR